MKENNNMEKKEIINGTEEELLAYFKQKYNLVEDNSKPAQEVPKTDVETTQESATRPADVGNKVTTGISGLFDGTSWGKR
jgi:hypothetical protein